ncbi:hypothetical protein ACQW02_01105 [Humitalea sp. 24SJ18S-53]|uniref:hypothetical protein n=1 Tax=Humitalea sp. 24SJ18S-53 TaxID=3422307 RepID=UPI003D6640D4
MTLGSARPVARATASLRLGMPLPDLAQPVPPPAPVVDPDAFDLDALLEEVRHSARESGFAAGHAAGLAAAREDTAAHMAATMAVVQAGLADLATGTAAQVEADATAVARLLSRAVDVALPYAAARDAPGQAARAAAAMVAMLSPGRVARCLVAAPLAEEVAALLTARGIALQVEGDAAMAPGDARLVWDGGALESVLAQRRAAIDEVLMAFGLTDHEESAA